MFIHREAPPVILCLSHLAWDHVWQRPHHILSRIAHTYPVTYISEPDITAPTNKGPGLRLLGDQGTLVAWEPVFPDRPAVMRAWRQTYVKTVRSQLVRQGWLHVERGKLVPTHPLILWFYTATPYYFLDEIPAHLVVYDIMDNLGGFKGAAADFPQRETALLGRADLVFTGGRSLYERYHGRHHNLHLFPSGVEADHFARAMHPETDVAAEIASLPGPVLGYYGVIDERIDLGLLDYLARERPDWSLVMVGPVAKIEPTDLPRHANLHYLGRQPYERLPNFLKGFDICLMPFAVNEATHNISPTKTLEYMAAHKPIVGTPVPDVVRNWGDVVQIAHSPEQFVAAVEQMLDETETERRARAVRERHYVRQSSWDQICRSMQHLIGDALARQLEQRFSLGVLT